MNFSRPIILILAIMLLSRAGAELMTPSEPSVHVSEDMDLEQVLPKEFGEWRLDSSVQTIQPTETGSLADRIYNQTVSRGYRNANGVLIMVVAAYGQNTICVSISP